MKDLNISINRISTLKHLIYYPLPKLSYINVDVHYNAIKQSLQHNMSADHIKDLFVSFYEKHKYLSDITFR
jgi:hypothetical protein